MVWRARAKRRPRAKRARKADSVRRRGRDRALGGRGDRVRRAWRDGGGAADDGLVLAAVARVELSENAPAVRAVDAVADGEAARVRARAVEEAHQDDGVPGAVLLVVVRPRRAVVRDDVALPAAPALLHDAREQKGVRAAAALALRAPVVARLQRHEVADVQRPRGGNDGPQLRAAPRRQRRRAARRTGHVRGAPSAVREEVESARHGPKTMISRPCKRRYRHRCRFRAAVSGPKCDISHFRRGAGWLLNGPGASRRWRRPGPFPAGAPPRHPRPRGPWDTSGQAPGPRTSALN